ncbi:MAG: NUDIX hydrolase [Planctomycetota bacterium]
MEVDPELLRHRPPALAIDVALLTLVHGRLCVVVMQRAAAPFAGHWVLPGGFVHLDETLDATVARVLKQKIGLEGVFVEQLFTFGELGRDPRGRVVTVAYYALVPAERLVALLRGPARLAEVHAPWSGLAGGDVELRDEHGKALRVGFDHASILGTALLRLRGKIDYAPIGFELLPDQFTLLELQVVHEAVLGTPLNKDSFRRRMLASGHLQATGRRRADVGHRPPRLFRFRGAKPANRPNKES